jgi:transposase-like protein
LKDPQQSHAGVAQLLGVSRATLYRALRRAREAQQNAEASSSEAQ